jgi:hypothetical protein
VEATYAEPRDLPPDLCPEHRRIARTWLDVHYNPRHPCEWPGGSIIMDARTSHATRAADWRRKTSDQVALIIRCCRRRTSPQCTTPNPDPPGAELQQITAGNPGATRRAGTAAAA